MQQQQEKTLRSVLNFAVLVASLGYFVDIFDLVLFGIIRVGSLKDLGLSGAAVSEVGLQLIDMQMAGMLIGGIIWGVLGDKRGRLSVLFGSILLYSFANIANGMTHSIDGYILWRFLAGLGLAGELGAGITLVAESLPKEKRGYGTMLVATVGVSGAVVANVLAKFFDWRMCYYIGGALGLALLLLRIGVLESGMFKSLKQRADVQRGNFLSLFTDKKKFIKYLKCILIGMPTWYVVGILIFFSNDFAKAMGVRGEINPGNAVMFCYAGLTIGDFMSGLVSQWLKSRKKSLLIFLTLTTIFNILYFQLYGASTFLFYSICFALGFSVGFWAIFVTVAAEQFGTNLRATVATTVPNFVRGMLVPISWLYVFVKGQTNLMTSGLAVGLLCLAISILASATIEESFHKELDYTEA